MTDLPKKTLAALSNVVSNAAGVAKKTFTLDMQVLDAAINEKQMMNSITFKMEEFENHLSNDLKESIDKNLECNFLKELLIKNFKEFIDEKILHSHFHSRNQKSNNINSLTIFYRHGLSKMISKMLEDVSGNTEIQTFFYDEITKVMEKLDVEQFHKVLLQEFGNPVPPTVTTANPVPPTVTTGNSDFMNTIMDDTDADDFLKSPFVTQDMKEKLFYELFKDDFEKIKQYFNNNLSSMNSIGFETIEELEDFYDRIEFKQIQQNEKKVKDDFTKGVSNIFTPSKTENPKHKKIKTTYISEDSIFSTI